MMSPSPFLQNKYRFFAIYAWIALAASLILLANELPFRINRTASMPRGIYLLSDVQTLHVGDLVMLCLEDSLARFARERGYISSGYCANGTQPLLKQVVARGGDLVDLTANAVIVNGHELPHSATLNRDSLNRSLPSIRRGTYRLNDHQLWLYGTQSIKSWDSRYFGIVDTARVAPTVTAKPLFVMSKRNQA